MSKVRLQKLDGIDLNIAEVEVLDINGNNLALGKVATQSSNATDADGAVMNLGSNAVNGVLNDFASVPGDEIGKRT